MDLQDLPRVDELASRLAGTGLPRLLAISIARDAIDTARNEIRSGGTSDPEAAALATAMLVAACRPTRIINATGVLLHTNLGRALLPGLAAESAAETAVTYGNVELDIRTGERGRRAAYGEHLLRALTGAGAALAVNNNAGALLLALAAIAGSGNTIVSRGEEIEIGGSFRLPELMAASGCRLVEVGTTNRTRLEDYEREIESAAAILKVHPSNYRVQGFAEAAPLEELAKLARRHDVPLIADIGSGLLDANVPWLPGSPPAWLAGEPAVRQALEAGADVVLFSGDKLLGGPQAGIAVGRDDLIHKMSLHPLARALRIDGATHAALVGTLKLYADDRGGEIPFWAMVSLGYSELEQRHQRLLDKLGGRGAVVRGESVPGAGSVPGEAIPSPNLQVPGNADDLFARLLGATPPILARRRHGKLIIDLRTVDPGDDPHVAETLA
jgi:L-seryl-tRNA(Ser) seleniumtransferase